MKQPCHDCGDATEKAEQQTAASRKQQGPQDRQCSLLSETDMISQSHKPTDLRNKRVFDLENRVCQIAANESASFSREQRLPISAKRQRIGYDLQTQAKPEQREPAVGLG